MSRHTPVYMLLVSLGFLSSLADPADTTLTHTQTTVEFNTTGVEFDLDADGDRHTSPSASWCWSIHYLNVKFIIQFQDN
jgi:hypothetical protein